MERLPVELYHNIFCFLDYQSLAAAQQVCRKWKLLASGDNLWTNLFKERWGEDQASFFAPSESKPWKDVYAVQDRCDRFGLGVKIIREGVDYYIISRGEIQHHLGSRRRRKGQYSLASRAQVDSDGDGEESFNAGHDLSMLDKILCFIGDLEAASAEVKSSRIV